MSKPKPRASAPPRMASNTQEPKAKFYDGPTVSAAEKAKARRKPPPSTPSAQQDAYKPPAAVPSITTKRTTNTPESQLQVVKVKRKKRSGWTLCGVITLLPLLIIASLFSTVLCPPPSAMPSTFSSMALGALGLRVKPAESSLHRTLCYPANVYHDEVLVPYIYPAIEDAKVQVASIPFYQHTVEPTYKKAKGHALKIWNGPVKPVVDRTFRGARIVHRTYIAPHVPYVKAKFTEATAPLRMRLCALYKIHVAPHVKVAKMRACAAIKSSKATFNQVAGHPTTKQAGKQAHNAFLFSQKQGTRAYAYSRPHAIWAYSEGKRHTRDTVIPRTIQGLNYAGKQVCNTWALIKAECAKLYAKHLAVHCDPYLAKANEALAPVCDNLNKQIYVPYIQPLVHSVLGPQAKQRSFWSFVAEFVPAAGSTVGQRGGQTVSEAKKAAQDVKKAAADVEKKAAEAKRTAEEKAAAARKAAEDKAAAAKQAAEDKAAAAKKAAEDKAADVKRVAEEKAAAAKKAAKDKAAAAEKAAEEKEAALKKKAEEAAAEAAAIEAEITANARAAFKKAEASRAAASNPDDLTRQAFVAATDDVTAAGTATVATTSLSGTVSGTATASAACDSATGAEAARDHVAEARAEIQQLKKRVDFQGKALHAKVQTETVKQAKHFLDLLADMKLIGDDNLEREIGRMMGGLDRLYSNSRSLTRHQVEESQRMSDTKVLKVLEQVTNGVKTKKNHIYEKTQPAVENAQAEIERVLGDDYSALGKRMGLIEGITPRDWTAYKALKKDVAVWKVKLAEAPEKNHSKQLKDAIQKAQSGAAELLTDFTDLYAGWKMRQESLRKQALDGIAAREALEAESKEVKRATQATIVAPKKPVEYKKAGAKGSILDIKEKSVDKEAEEAKGSILDIKDKSVDKEAEEAKGKSTKDEL
ncbi:hypothetical protein CcaverHIS002_0502870 [Cutaneotrichosporon cavernicola]|uniref:Uncharacterized protein n=1 Tax=Cutaneotrichosporon cavernicola TaxID=279322 RepID=A0AA48QWU8_9TREE|nr:uncharacterized protein CcaverHIS019_0503440 [Cutaneotrichosporon cavernicola]BEI84886.1 hypothetical protein CcaverHIS002_0502870 [Cutaneotrichosporon cavernicola]BEI92716.1 hypothetical protein CcaverHIS019_0503440 [Cutaneotrichosporon cavernicola]BEJ00493.1 hypothetical protein CcaverHIS631_0503500 [Cutaneotrichosporon cavernicola]BEJ08262.1 hypothetical protein CcaverHIS641_0503470 [Cutaneotrichosporon cavernicola]